MKSPYTYPLLLVSSLVAVFLFFTSCEEGQKQAKRTDWPVYSADPGGSKFSPLDQINRDNVKNLRPAWIYRTGDARQQPRSTIECNPLIVKNRVFLTTAGLKVVALEAGTGEEIWKFDPYQGQQSSGVNRGVSYWTDGTDERIFFVAGSYIYGLDAQTGKLIHDFGVEGKADLYEGLGRNVRHTWVTAATPGAIYKDLLIMGTTLGEGPGPAAPGHIRAYHVKDGSLAWTFHTIPWPGEEGYETWPPDAWERIGGVNAWGGFTLDTGSGILYCGTGSATYDHWGGDRVGQNLFANCVLALDALTGQRVWHYQLVHHDIWDYDVPCPPNLVQVEKDGKLIDAVAQPTKMGQLYVLDRKTGVPVFPIEEIQVPTSTIPGEQSWPTQPFPPASLRYASQQFTPDEITDLSDSAYQHVYEQVKDLQMGGLFMPPSLEGVTVLPQFNGGTDWGGAAYDPRGRTLFVNSSNEVEWISMIASKPPDEISQYDLGRNLYRSACSACHGNSSSALNPGSPSLDSLKGLVKQKTLEEVRHTLKNGKGQMPTFAGLSDDEREAAIAYLREEGKEIMLETSKIGLTFSSHIPYVATGHNELKDHEGFPGNKRPWGTLTAIDMDKGKISWQVPLGTYPELEARGFPPTGTFNMGGPIVTAGGLVFIGGTMDERFRAFHSETGDVLWEFQLDAGGYATPSTFEVEGVQYVIIAAGGGGKPGTKPGDAYYCFALQE